MYKRRVNFQLKDFKEDRMFKMRPMLLEELIQVLWRIFFYVFPSIFQFRNPMDFMRIKTQWGFYVGSGAKG